MSVGIYFRTSESGEEIRRAIQETYRIEPTLIYVGPYGDLNSYAGPDPIALITPNKGSTSFGWELSGGDYFLELTEESELELARTICRVVGTRALVDDGSPAPDYWYLVTEDGSFGRVLTGSEGDDLAVLYAFESIAGAPELAVVPPPDWARHWAEDDGEQPELK